VFVYPELSSMPPGGAADAYIKHGPAGVGTSFVLKKDEDSQIMVHGSSVLRRPVAVLPAGFIESIGAKRVAKQNVDYLPQVLNLPLARNVGRVKPRSAAVDWLAIGFDPWSAGKMPLSTEFISTLAGKDGLFDVQKANLKKAIGDGVIEVKDTEGLNAQNIEMSRAAKLADDFKKVCSLCRHSKFSDVEDLMNHPDWSLSMDYQDNAGNTLLHVAAQNGNKRMIKLCIRRGADLNIQNLNGQTALHFAYAYGYADVGQYLIDKGANDSIVNKDGLTCFEGLSAQEITNM
jgi:hypothetical protein